MAVSVIGTAHESAGVPCQDYSAVQIFPTSQGDVLVAVASDGAGSAARAAAGAARVCEAVLSWVQWHLAGDDTLIRVLDEAPDVAARDLIDEIRKAIAAEAESESQTCDAFAATLLAALVAPQRSLVVQLGDGAIVHRTIADPAWRLALAGHRGEYANETVFVTSPRAAEVVRAAVVPSPMADVDPWTIGAAVGYRFRAAKPIRPTLAARGSAGSALSFRFRASGPRFRPAPSPRSRRRGRRARLLILSFCAGTARPTMVGPSRVCGPVLAKRRRARRRSISRGLGWARKAASAQA